MTVRESTSRKGTRWAVIWKWNTRRKARRALVIALAEAHAPRYVDALVQGTRWPAEDGSLLVSLRGRSVASPRS
jgi:hypothetical protein